MLLSSKFFICLNWKILNVHAVVNLLSLLRICASRQMQIVALTGFMSRHLSFRWMVGFYEHLTEAIETAISR